MELTPELLKDILNSVINVRNANDTQTRSEPMYQVKPPEGFNFQDPATWTNWIKRFKMFRSATGLANKPEDQQVNMLLYCMGQEAEELLTSLGMTEEERTSFETVVTKFEDYFSTKKNIFYHRALFLQRNQKSEEKIDLFINDLHKMSEKCEWICGKCSSRSFSDDMILLKLVTGINDRSLSKHLQLQEGITLTKAVQAVRQAEAMEKQNAIEDQGNVAESSVMETRRNFTQKFGKTSQSSNMSQICRWCGLKQIHPKEKCPARDKICFKCGLKGHFSQVCRRKSAGSVQEVESESNENRSDSIQLSTITIDERVSEPRSSDPFYVNLLVNGK